MSEKFPYSTSSIFSTFKIEDNFNENVLCTQLEQKKALVSPLLLDDFVEDGEANCLNDSPEDEQTDLEVELLSKDFNCAYNNLKDIDPFAATELIQIMAERCGLYCGM